MFFQRNSFGTPLIDRGTVRTLTEPLLDHWRSKNQAEQG
jgi:hypothetical protein